MRHSPVPPLPQMDVDNTGVTAPIIDAPRRRQAPLRLAVPSMRIRRRRRRGAAPWAKRPLSAEHLPDRHPNDRSAPTRAVASSGPTMSGPMTLSKIGPMTGEHTAAISGSEQRLRGIDNRKGSPERLERAERRVRNAGRCVGCPLQLGSRLQVGKMPGRRPNPRHESGQRNPAISRTVQDKSQGWPNGASPLATSIRKLSAFSS